MAKELKYIIKVKDSASRVLKGISGSFRKMAGGLKSGFAKLRGSWIAGFLSMAGAVVAFKKVIGASFKFEAMTRDFKVLLGSMEEAEKRMRVLGSITSGTRFELKGVAEASKHLHTLSEGAMGGAASLRLVGDAAASTNQEIEDVGYWFGKAYGAIRDGKSFDNAASSLRDMGVLSADAHDRMEELQKSGGKASEIFKILQDDLQQFSGGMEEATATGNDLVAELRGSVQGAIKDVGDEFQEASKGGLQTLIKKVNELRDSGALVAWVDKWQQRFEKALPTLSRMAQGLGNIADTIERRYSRLGGTVGAILGGASIKDALEIGKQVVSDEDDRAARVQAKAMLDRVAEKAQAEKEAAESAYKEQQKIDADLAKADLKQIERNAAKRAKEAEKAAKKILAAEKKLASEKEKLQKKIAAAEERSVKDILSARKKAIDDEIRYREQRIQDSERDLAEKKEQFGKGFSERARDRREAKEEQDKEERIRRAAERGEKKLARQAAGVGRSKDNLTNREREAVEIVRLEREIAADRKKAEELKRDQAKAAAVAMAKENARAAAELKAHRDRLAELEALDNVTISAPEIDLPEIKVPEIEIKVPEIDVPEIDVPEIKVPAVDPVSVEFNIEDDSTWLDDAKTLFEKPIDVDAPEVKVPEIKVPEVDEPEIDFPDFKFKVPEIDAPEITLSDIEVDPPEISVPDIAPPDTNVPDIVTAEITVPDIEINAPEIKVPDIDVPEVDAPKIDVPDIDVPKIDVPDIEVDAPKIEVPEIEVPDIKIPDIKVNAPKVELTDLEKMSPQLKGFVDEDKSLSGRVRIRRREIFEKEKGEGDENTLAGRAKSKLQQLAANNIESGFKKLNADGSKMSMSERKAFKKAEKEAQGKLTAKLAYDEANANINSERHLRAISSVIASTDKGGQGA